MPSKRPSPSAARGGGPPDAAVALILFTDIRGFTRWSEANEVFANLDDFATGFIQLIHDHFPNDFVKGLGDGAMIVRELAAGGQASLTVLAEALRTIAQLEDRFAAFCQEFAQQIGHKTDLRLGWGVVRGAVKKTRNDYVGSNLNKCARLCDAARPYGLVVDRDEFPDAPQAADPDRYQFSPQSRRLSGIGEEVGVWVTQPVAARFVARESLKQTPEVHVAGLCVDANDRRGLRILLARRASSRRLYPGKLEGCGGQLARSESFTEGVARHYRQEMGIEVRVLEEIHCFYEIRVPDEPLIPGIRFLCEREDDTPPASINHSEVQWAFEADLRKLPADQFIEGLKDQFLLLLDHYHRRRAAAHRPEDS